MDPIRILLVGNGGREHALAWKLSQSPRVESIITVRGLVSNVIRASWDIQ